MERFAHSVEGQPERHWEPLSHHLAMAAPLGGSTIALAMDLLHDIGKTALLYQLYIRRPADKGGPKGPDHSSAGAKEAVNLCGGQLGRMMAFGIAGHLRGWRTGRGMKAATCPRGWRRMSKIMPAGGIMWRTCRQPRC